MVGMNAKQRKVERKHRKRKKRLKEKQRELAAAGGAVRAPSPRR
jgi:hypothetical protein